MLTPAQRDVLLFIDSYTRQHHCAPSYVEMMDRFSIRSKGTISRMVRILVGRGFLRHTQAAHRSVEVVRLPPGLPPTPQQEWADPVAICRDAEEILAIVAAERAAQLGEADDVLDDLLERIKAANAASATAPAQAAPSVKSAKGNA